MLSLETQNHYFLTKSKRDRDFEHATRKANIFIKNTARHFAISVWSDFGSVFKLVHVEIVSL